MNFHELFPRKYIADSHIRENSSRFLGLKVRSCDLLVL